MARTLIPSALSMLAAIFAASGALARSDPAPAAAPRVDAFEGWWHDGGNLLLHVSNRGVFGGRGADAGAPSAEWPAGTGHEHLYGAGLWVGGVVGGETRTTAGLYQLGEFWNHEEDEGCGDPPQGICETAQGAPNGLRFFDDDGDGAIDEERLDGRDNDGDTLVDEDFAAISDQMFATETYDSSTFFNQFFPDPVDQHHPLGLHVKQETYVWSHPTVDDFVGVDLTITNASRDIDGIGWPIENVYVGMLVDGDVGVGENDLNYWLDDQAAYLERDGVRMAYVFDEPGSGLEDVNSYLGVLLLDHTVDAEGTNAPTDVNVHAFRVWSSGADDPRDDLDRYEFLRGAGDETRTIDPRTTIPNDYRFTISAGPFGVLPVDGSITVQLAFVGGEMLEVANPETGGTVRVPDLTNALAAQAVYDGISADARETHWAAGLPPAAPGVRASAGNGAVTIEWDGLAQEVPDPILGGLDFAGYTIERTTGEEGASRWTTVASFPGDGLDAIDTGKPGIGRYSFEDRGVRNFRGYRYRVRTWDRSGLSSASAATRVDPAAEPASAPEPVRVEPNPIRLSGGGGSAAVGFANLPEGARVRIYSIDGRRVATLAGAGDGGARWVPDAAGVYLYRVASPEGTVREGKIVVLR